MGIEIERKFLVHGSDWRTADGELLRQGYLQRHPDRTVRVRIAGQQAFLTVKGRSSQSAPGSSPQRLEYEWPIPLNEAQALLALCEGPLVEKVRHRVGHAGLVWEVDEFQGDNAPLVLAEVELPHPDHPFECPPWVAQEVSHDPRYFNSHLSQHPYGQWRDSEGQP